MTCNNTKTQLYCGSNWNLERCVLFFYFFEFVEKSNEKILAIFSKLFFRGRLTSRHKVLSWFLLSSYIGSALDHRSSFRVWQIKIINSWIGVGPNYAVRRKFITSDYRWQCLLLLHDSECDDTQKDRHGIDINFEQSRCVSASCEIGFRGD